jgi:transposase
VKESERGQIIGTRLAEASMIKTATLLCVSRGTLSKVISAHMNHGKKTSAKWNSGRKSKLTERDRRTLRRAVSKNNTNTAALVTGQQN